MQSVQLNNPIDDADDALGILAGDGEMATLMRAHDWSATPVGPVRNWPPPLRTVIRLLLNTRHPMFVFWGPTLACFYNDAYSASIGPERHPVCLGRPGREVWAEIWDIIGPQIDFVMAGRGATWHENDLIPITRHGKREDVYWTYSYSPIDDETSVTGIGGVLVICTETTAQVLARRREEKRAIARKAERDRLSQMFEQAPSFMAMLTGPEHRIDLANQAYLRLIGRRDVLGKTVAEALPDIVEQGYLALLDEVFRSGNAFSSVGAKYAVQATQGGPVNERFVDFIYQPVKNDDHEVTGIFVEGSDVTDRTVAEAALRTLNDTLEQRILAEAAARAQTEAALHQAQKMEVIGQLTGGIAHDFNNMLQAITGGITLARRRMDSPRNEDVLKFLDLATDAANRAATLTRRLLAFGRRQPLNPKSVNLDDLISGMEELIQRTVGPQIRVEIRAMDDRWPVRCDPNQLESALLNLAINARDAMLPTGGRFTVETTNIVVSDADALAWEGATPGDYVRIKVIDTGVGMSSDVLTHAFEPFFTTKPDGQGTGLGLSQVYGFVRQSHGLVHLASEVGVGTSVDVYLPRGDHMPNALSEVAPSETRPEPASDELAGTVLLVEDEATVRVGVAEALRQRGFRVIEAENGLAGLDAVHKSLHDPASINIDLLATDIGLPGGLNGRQLADAARELNSRLPVLLITGYAGDAMKGGGQLGPGMEILVKPFELDVLAERVRAMIGR
jgi:signal transduction histidine kinase/ActR/RegA family two-component response regulator